MKLIKQFLLYFLGSILLGFSLLYVSYSVKSKKLYQNIGSSLATFESEGIYPSYGKYPRKIVLDNFTDALMINTAYSAVDNATDFVMFNPRLMKDETEINQISNLKAAYENTAKLKSNYERYWHGYLVFIRPLLSITSYEGIRILLNIFIYLLFFYLSFLLIKNKHFIHFFAILAAAFSIDLFYLGQSIQFSQVFIIGMIFSIYYLMNIKRNLNLLIIFFILGMCTAYFDLLTAPLVTLGFLLVISTTEENLIDLIKKCLSWGVGYGLFWMSKWIIIEIFFHQGAIKNAMFHVMNRSLNQADENFSHFRTLLLNIFQLIGYEKLSKILFLIILLFLLIIFFIFKKKKIDFKKITYWFTVALIPYLWFLLAANHSYLHVWYTYRAQFMSVAAGLIAYANLIDKKKIILFIKKITFKTNKN